MKKFLCNYIVVVSLILFYLYLCATSEGVRSGQLIKFSHKGMAFKTWEGEISQGISGAQIFSFSVLDKDQKVINDLKS
jgi:hypothetical protein